MQGVHLTETGANTGAFSNHDKLQPATAKPITYESGIDADSGDVMKVIDVDRYDPTDKHDWHARVAERRFSHKIDPSMEGAPPILKLTGYT